jgi:caffeoyl-CoA O-methyltransferase
MLSDVFQKDLENYLIQVATSEGELLQALREETQAFSPVAHMICGPIEGRLLAMLIQLSSAKRILEVGTFTGYSALYMASYLPPEGKLITCELREDHAEFAKRYFAKSEAGKKITLLMGEAAKTLPTLQEEFDFIFLDADKANYPLYYDLLIPKLRTGGLMVVDNALWRGEVVHPQSKEAIAIDTLNRKASLDPHVETVMLTVRDGLLLIRKN